MTGVEHDDIRVHAFLGSHHALSAQHLGHAFAIVDIHLAAKGFYVKCFRFFAIHMLIYTVAAAPAIGGRQAAIFRSEEHTSELQSLMRISYAVFCLKKKN